MRRQGDSGSVWQGVSSLAAPRIAWEHLESTACLALHTSGVLTRRLGESSELSYFSHASQVVVKPHPDPQPHPGSRVPRTVNSVVSRKAGLQTQNSLFF